MALDIGRVVVRVLLTYVTLLILLRLAGKRSIYHATPFDFVFSIIIGDLIDDIIWMEVGYATGVVAAGGLVLAHMLTQLLSCVSPAFDKLVEGRPVPLFTAGQVNEAGRTQERVDHNDLEGMLRLFGQVDLAEAPQEIEQAQLEPSGGLSVKHWGRARPAQKRDKDRLSREKT